MAQFPARFGVALSPPGQRQRRRLTTPFDIALLAVAGLAGGLLNAIAGGGTFVTLGAMVFIGIPSIVANATSSVALFPGALASAWEYRRDLPKLTNVRRSSLILASLAGSGLGAALLLVTPQSRFDAIVPWLLLGATLVFAFGPRLIPLLSRLIRFGPVTLLAVQFLIAIYGGYFGGAMGILMLASFSLFGLPDFHAMNALKTLLAGLLNALAVAIFIAAGKIAWGPGALMMAAGIAGGWLGAWGARKVPPAVLRRLAIALAALITAAFFVRAWR